MTDQSREQFDAQECTSKSVDDQKSPKVNDNRATFEAHFQLSQRQAKRDNSGSYIDEKVRDKWEGWQAAMAGTVPYNVALTAIERLQGAAMTTIDDHSKDCYTLNDMTMPQQVAWDWAREIERIDAKVYLDEAIQDAKDDAAKQLCA